MDVSFRKLPYRRLMTHVASIARPTGRLGGFPTGRPWVFASSATFVAFLPRESHSFPRPIPRIRETFTEHYCRLDSAGPHAATQGGISPRMAASTTSGDLNPTCLELFGSLVSGGLIAGRRSRRTRNCLLRTAYCLSGPVSVLGSLFLFRRSLSCPTTREKYIQSGKKFAQIPSCATAHPTTYPQPMRNLISRPTFNCA